MTSEKSRQTRGGAGPPEPQPQHSSGRWSSQDWSSRTRQCRSKQRLAQLEMVSPQLACCDSGSTEQASASEPSETPPQQLVRAHAVQPHIRLWVMLEPGRGGGRGRGSALDDSLSAHESKRPSKATDTQRSTFVTTRLPCLGTPATARALGPNQVPGSGSGKPRRATQSGRSSSDRLVPAPSDAACSRLTNAATTPSSAADRNACRTM